jgi:hypothetical protein
MGIAEVAGRRGRGVGGAPASQEVELLLGLAVRRPLDRMPAGRARADVHGAGQAGWCTQEGWHGVVVRSGDLFRGALVEAAG